MTVKSFYHLNQEKRIEIYHHLLNGLSYRKIASIIWVSHSTISREVSRNSIDYWWEVFKYKPLKAQIKYIKRRKKANLNHVKLIKNNSLRNKILSLLSDKSKKWSPDEIIGRLKIEWWNVVSVSTLYRYIHYRSNNRHRYLLFWKEWYKNRKRKRRIYKEKIKNIPKIDQRPDEANNRDRIWDREIDTMHSYWHKWWLFTATDRYSRFLIADKVNDLSSKTIYYKMIQCLYSQNIKTITSDNWGEFSDLYNFTKVVWCNWYTAHPYCSHERWTNERHNWFIRWFIPKGSDIKNYSDEEIKVVQKKINHKPRRCLGYKTPYEIYYGVQVTYIN